MNAPEPFNESRESQDAYCRGCVHADACNVMLDDGEDCGDRYEITAIDQTDAGRQAQRNAERNAQSMIEVDSRRADEEAADFDAQVRDCLAHWPGIQAVDLDA